jgi:hypothetical protein
VSSSPAQSSCPSSAWAVRLGGAAWAVLTLLHVLEGGTAETAERVLPEPLNVEWGHCTVVARDSERLCLYDPADPVRLWVDHPRASEARVRIDGVEVAVERYPLAAEPAGEGLRVLIPPGAFELELEVPDTDGVREWGLTLSESERPLAEPRVRLDPADLEELGRAQGSSDVARLERATSNVVDGLLAGGRVGEAVVILCGASFLLRRLRAFEAAATMLERAQAIGASFPVGRNTAAAYRGVLLWSQGVLHEAAPLLRDGARYSLRVEDPVLAADSLPIYAETLAELGYYEEARYWAHESLEHLPSLPCHRASVLRTAGWINLVLGARDQPHDDPRPHLREAIDLYRTQAECAHKEGGARLSLALLAFQDGDAAVAGEQLAAIDTHTLSVEDRVRAADLRVRLQALEADVAAAWRAWSELQAAASVVDDDDAQWRVEVRRGEIHVREHDAHAALAAFERAEQRLDRLVRAQAVMGVGRTATADRYLEGTTALVSLLALQGQLPRALCVAREARARRRSAAAGIDVLPAAEREVVREQLRRYREHKRLADQTEALVPERPQAHESALLHDAARSSREAARLVDEIVEALMRATASPRCHELVAAAPGELLVGLYPRANDWLVFTQDERGTTEAHVIEAPTDAELAGDPRGLERRLLEPISGALAGASRVRVLADRQAQEIDVHLLEWRGQPLLAQLPVTYGVELPALPDPVLADPPRALLLADPTGTLMSARVEVEAVADQLGRAHWKVDVPATDDPETPVEVAFGGYSLLHYAAHTATREGTSGVWAPYPAGEVGGLPHLQTGPLARLEVHDILALRPVPPVAFLAGCKTGLVELDAGSTSVALAFLLADGRQVVASRENVDDAVGLEIAQRFYERFVRGADVAVAMHEVQRELHEDGEVVPYRVWVR